MRIAASLLVGIASVAWLLLPDLDLGDLLVLFVFPVGLAVLGFVVAAVVRRQYAACWLALLAGQVLGWSLSYFGVWLPSLPEVSPSDDDPRVFPLLLILWTLPTSIGYGLAVLKRRAQDRGRGQSQAPVEGTEKLWDRWRGYWASLSTGWRILTIVLLIGFVLQAPKALVAAVYLVGFAATGLASSGDEAGLDGFTVGGIMALALVGVAVVAMLRLRRPRMRYGTRKGSRWERTADDRLALIHWSGLVGVLGLALISGLFILLGIPGDGPPVPAGIAAGVVVGGGALVVYMLVRWELHRHGDGASLVGRDLATWAWAFLPLVASMLFAAVGFMGGILASPR